MKTILSALCFLLLFSYCVRNGLTQQAPALGQEVSLKVKESAILHKSDSDEITIRVDSIQDSRCPKEVTCIWNGNAHVSFTTLYKQMSQIGKVCIGTCPDGFRTADTTQIQFSGVAYEVILQGVDPYPGKEENQEPKKARLLVRSR